MLGGTTKNTSVSQRGVIDLPTRQVYEFFTNLVSKIACHPLATFTGILVPFSIFEPALIKFFRLESWDLLPGALFSM